MGFERRDGGLAVADRGAAASWTAATPKVSAHCSTTSRCWSTPRWKCSATRSPARNGDRRREGCGQHTRGVPARPSRSPRSSTSSTSPASHWSDRLSDGTRERRTRPGGRYLVCGGERRPRRLEMIVSSAEGVDLWVGAVVPCLEGKSLRTAPRRPEHRGHLGREHVVRLRVARACQPDASIRARRDATVQRVRTSCGVYGWQGWGYGERCFRVRRAAFGAWLRSPPVRGRTSSGAHVPRPLRGMATERDAWLEGVSRVCVG